MLPGETIAVQRAVLRNWRTLVPARDGGGTFSSPRKENKSFGGPSGPTETMEPICSAPPFLLSLFSFTSAHFLSFFHTSQLPPLCRFSTHRPNLCYLLVTFIWSPRVLDLSLGLLSHSPSTFFPSLPLVLSSPLSFAIAHQQPAAPNSPELLIPDFRPVGKSLSPPYPPPQPFPQPLLSLLVLLPTTLSLDAAVLLALPPGLSYQGWLNLSHDFC